MEKRIFGDINMLNLSGSMRTSKFLLVALVVGLVVFKDVKNVKAVAFTCEWCGNSCVKADPTRECAQDYLPSDNFNKECVLENNECVIKEIGGEISLTPTLTPVPTRTICSKQPIGVCQTETDVPNGCPQIDNLPDGTACSTDVLSNGVLPS